MVPRFITSLNKKFIHVFQYPINILNSLNRQSSTEDEEPLVPIDPSDLIHLFPDADNAQYHDGLTDSDGRLSQNQLI